MGATHVACISLGRWLINIWYMFLELMTTLMRYYYFVMKYLFNDFHFRSMSSQNVFTFFHLFLSLIAAVQGNIDIRNKVFVSSFHLVYFFVRRREKLAIKLFTVTGRERFARLMSPMFLTIYKFIFISSSKTGKSLFCIFANAQNSEHVFSLNYFLVAEIHTKQNCKLFFLLMVVNKF